MKEKEDRSYTITANPLQKWKLKTPESVRKEKIEREDKLKVRDKEEDEKIEDYISYLNEQIEIKNGYILYLENEVSERDAYTRGLKAGLGKLAELGARRGIIK